MASSASRGMVYGAFHLQAAFRNASGYPLGTDTTPDTVTAPQTTHSYLIGGLVSFTAPTPTRDIATNIGGQKLIGSAVLGVTDFGTPAFTLSEYNEVLNAFIKATTADTTTNTEWTMSAANSSQTEFDRFVILVTGKFLDSVSLSEYHLTWVFHNAQVVEATPPGTSQSGGVNPNPVGYTMNLTGSTRNGLTGRAFSASSGMSVVDGTDTWTLVRSRWPIAITTFTADGVEVGYTLGYRPVYDDATGAATNSLTLNGVTDAVTSVSTTTGAVVYTPAGTTADIYVAAYQTRFVAI